jgi:hypothetical protein
MSLKLNSSGGGSVLLQEPSTASNRTLTLPDANTTAVGTDATQTLSNKTFSGAQTFGTASFPEPSGSAPLYAARAWVNFNGTGTVAIRASGNVSSITDGGVGIYTVNLTTAMPDENFSVGAITNSNTGDASRPVVPVRTGSSTSSVVIQTVGTFNNNTNVDCSIVNVSVHR